MITDYQSHYAEKCTVGYCVELLFLNMQFTSKSDLEYMYV